METRIRKSPHFYPGTAPFSLCKWAPVTHRVFIFLGLPAVRLELGCTSGSPEGHLKRPSAQLLPR